MCTKLEMANQSHKGFNNENLGGRWDLFRHQTLKNGVLAIVNSRTYTILTYILPQFTNEANLHPRTSLILA